ncbi:MAG TPA: response regulator [Clostridia bacterium]|nr:response regulator [Clostridia bacterium]
MYQVIIIEDDPMVAAINRKYVEDTPEFVVKNVFQNGAQALEYLKDNDVSLIILDYYTPMMSGMAFVDMLHGMGKAPAIIMVTSASDVQIVKSMFSRGVIDYLVKPFEYDRFKSALERFKQSMSRWKGTCTSLKQEEIDSMITPESASETKQIIQTLSKGLNETTMIMIRQFLSDNSTEFFTSEEIASHVNLSRITVRRYMNYMLETNQVISTIDYQTGGRPSIKYHFV